MGKSVLIVDDDVKFADNLGQYLSLMGYDVKKAATGNQALDLVESTKPDILLCDLKLPDIDGDEVTRKVRTISPETILFIISAYVDSSVEERLKKLGVYSFIQKPVMFDDVVSLFKEALGNRA